MNAMQRIRLDSFRAFSRIGSTCKRASANAPSPIHWAGSRFMSTVSTPSGTFIRLPTRGLLEIRGKDASKFLQGLITNNMQRIENGGSGFLAAFLSPKGRVMYDVFIHPTNASTDEVDQTYLIECDARALPELHKHIARFILRSKVKLVGVTESFDVYSVLDDHRDSAGVEETIPSNSEVMERLGKMHATIGMLDNRAASLMGYRVIVPKGQPLSLPESYKQGTLEDYNVRRIINGVPEGIDDFIAGTSLPLELNIDYMNGVDFRKGCYVGQELTIRTHHKGIIRKRVMPVQYLRPDEIEPESIQFNKNESHVIPPQSELFSVKSEESSSQPAASSSSARPVRASGKTGSNIGNIGLALVKLDDVVGGSTFNVMDREGAIVRAKAFFPTWWPKQSTNEEKSSE